MLTEPREALARSSPYALPTDHPGWINLTTVYEGTPDPLHTMAIFGIDGDCLRYCVAAPGQPRPTEFVTKKGDGNTLVSLKRHVSK